MMQSRSLQGSLASVTDEELSHAQRMLARMEGIFAEPASATGIAGLLKSNNNGQIPLRSYGSRNSNWTRIKRSRNSCRKFESKVSCN